MNENSLDNIAQQGSGEEPILVLGLGNPLYGDDGLGLSALESLRGLGPFATGVDLVDGGTMGLYLIDRISGYEKVLILDSLKVDEAPGTVVMVEGDDVATTFRTKLSAHQMGFNDLLSALTLMDRRPGEIIVIGMVPQTLELGMGLSKPVEASIPRMAQTALLVLDRWGGRG